MRRALVLSDEAARHPFLASLPQHVRKGTVPRPARSKWQLTRADVRGFLATYFASLLAIIIFIA